MRAYTHLLNSAQLQSFWIAEKIDGIFRNYPAVEIALPYLTKSTGLNFQVISCHKDCSDQVVMALGSFLFHTNGQRGALASTTPTLNEVSYSTVREAVVNLLGDNANTFIGELKIWNLKGETVVYYLGTASAVYNKKFKSLAVFCCCMSYCL